MHWLPLHSTHIVTEFCSLTAFTVLFSPTIFSPVCIVPVAHAKGSCCSSLVGIGPENNLGQSLKIGFMPTWLNGL